MIDGKIDVQLDEKSHILEGSWVITIPAGAVHGFHFSPDTKGVVLTIAEPILTDQSQQKAQLYIDALTQTPRTIRFDKEDVLLDQISQYLNIIKSEINNTDTGQQLMLEWLVMMVLITLKRQCDHRELEAAEDSSSNHMLSTLRGLLEQHYQHQWKVQQYADAMNTSVSSLNRLCHETIGVTPKALILDRVLIEAKRKLIYTREALDLIAYDLGFKDPAYFSRFFKKMEGVSPSQYRNSNNYDTTSYTADKT
ncbi:MAG: helix-turn-helix domain-containing protein [Halopseudomonas sp.]